MSKMRHIFLGFPSIFLCVQHTHSCGIKYVSKDAAAAHNEWVAEQEAIAAAEAAEESEYYYYDDASGSGDMEYEECLVCEEGEYEEYDEDPAPRFFFSQISQIFDTTRSVWCVRRESMRSTTRIPP